MIAQAISCTLCGLPTHHPLTDDQGSLFCCAACREVSHLLAESKPAAPPLATASSSTLLHLGGLWCSSCAWLVGERLRRTPGVGQAETSFIRREARIQFDPQQTTPAKLARQVRRGGYRAWLEGDTPYDEEEAHWMRLLIGGVLAMKVMVISFIIYIRQWLGLAHPETEWLAHFFHIMMIPLTVGVLLTLGVPIFRAGWAALRQGRPNTHSLIALGSLAAFGLSIRNVLLGGSVYFDTTAVLLFLLAVGRWLEMQAQQESRRAVEQLWQQIPPEASWLTAVGEQRIPADTVPLGGRVRVRPGERVPVDGLVAAGQSELDESWLTGEPEPVLRREGQPVLAGSINLDGSLEVVTTATGTQTVVGQIGRLLHEATWQRSPVERHADRIAAWMMPIAVTLATLAFAVWSLVRGVETGLIIALSVLLIACPCALGVATPLTLWLGLGRAAEAGVILRRTAVLEQLAQVRHAFFDKTGTLTIRPLQLQHIMALGDQAQLQQWVISLEQHSEHPLGQAIAQWPGKTTPNLPVQAFQNLPGQGVRGVVAGTEVWVGSRALMTTAAFSFSPELSQQAQRWQQAGLRVLFVGWGGQVQGLLALGERLRGETAVLFHQLKELGIEVAVLTGDEAASGERWQRQLGVAVHAGLRPEEKLNWLREKTAVGGTLMVGDGMNDSPALAAATVGLALRHGTDIACAAADAILLHDNLQTIPWLIALSRRTLQTVQQNLTWAFAYNLVGIILALAGLLQPAIAALFMVGSNLIVTTNALRLRRWSFTQTSPESYPEHGHKLVSWEGKLEVGD